MCITGGAAEDLRTFWQKWEQSIVERRLYFGWNCSVLDSFHHELLVHRDKIHFWKWYMALRQKLAMIRHNVGHGNFVEWLLTL